MSGGWICGIGVSPFAFAAAAVTAAEDRTEEKRREREMEEDRSIGFALHAPPPPPGRRAKRWIVIGSESESHSFRVSQPLFFLCLIRHSNVASESLLSPKGPKRKLPGGVRHPRDRPFKFASRPTNPQFPHSSVPPLLSSPSRHWRPTAKP